MTLGNGVTPAGGQIERRADSVNDLDTSGKPL